MPKRLKMKMKSDWNPVRHRVTQAEVQHTARKLEIWFSDSSGAITSRREGEDEVTVLLSSTAIE